MINFKLNNNCVNLPLQRGTYIILNAFQSRVSYTNNNQCNVNYRMLIMIRHPLLQLQYFYLLIHIRCASVSQIINCKGYFICYSNFVLCFININTCGTCYTQCHVCITSVLQFCVVLCTLNGFCCKSVRVYSNGSIQICILDFAHNTSRRRSSVSKLIVSLYNMCTAIYFIFNPVFT